LILPGWQKALVEKNGSAQWEVDFYHIIS